MILIATKLYIVSDTPINLTGIIGEVVNVKEDEFIRALAHLRAADPREGISTDALDAARSFLHVEQCKKVLGEGD